MNSNQNQNYPTEDDLFQSEDVNTSGSQTDQNNQEPDGEQNPLGLDEKKKKIIILSATIVVALLLIIYFWGVIYFHYRYLPYTQVNGVDVGWQTPEEAVETLDKTLYNRSVAIIAEDGRDSVDGAEIDLEFNDDDISALKELVDSQDSYAWQVQIVLRRELDLNSDFSYNDERLTNILNSMSIVSGPQVVVPRDAQIVYNGSEYVIDPSVEGDQPNVDELKEAVVHALVVGDTEINLTESGLYNEPSVTEDNEQLQENLEQYNTAIKAVITMNFPTQQVVLNKDTFQPWLYVDNGTVNVDDNLNTYVANLANQFDTANRDLSFRATNGDTYYFKDSSGWLLNQSGEVDELRSQILAGQVLTEDPVWSQRGQNALVGPTISGNYIEVSLDSQHLWLYKNNALVTSTDIVSGDVARNQATSTGLFFLQAKDNNTTLTVYYPDGSQKSVQVRYWMPFTSYYGIESASFRTDFGGNIYRTQGTDGDIDVPESAAQAIYNNVDTGIPIVIY